MKRFVIAMTLASIAALAPARSALSSVVPLAQRVSEIFFQGSLADSQDRAYSGPADVKIAFYKGPAAQPADLLYAEEFSSVAVKQGEFRIPILSGTPVDGNKDALRAADEAYAFVTIDGKAMLEAWPIGSKFAAIRAERAIEADVLRLPLEIDASAIPEHPASGHITSGALDAARFQQIPASLVTQGVFPTDAMPPGIDASAINSGTFGPDAFGSGIDASWFTTGTIPDAVMPDGIMKSANVGVASGAVSHGQAVGVPSGFERSQCVWVVGVNHIQSQGKGTGIDHIHVYTDSDGVVFCKWDHVTAEPMKFECTANYLTICRK